MLVFKCVHVWERGVEYFVSDPYIVFFFFSFPVDPVDAESTKMDSNFSLTGLPGSPKKRMRIECKCGVPTCRKYLF